MGIEKISSFWPDWKVGQILGEGSFGKVYKAVREDHSLRSEAAIKLISVPSGIGELKALRAEGMSEEETRGYIEGIVNDFINEIKLMETMKGVSNIVSVEDYKIIEKENEFGWEIFIRMELLDTFDAYLENHTPTEKEIIKIATDLCSALEICYKNNIIHRDIKPANIFVSKYGDFKIGDFGIAKELSKTSGAMSSKGTFTYMAPEVAHGKSYDATVDIYSLGIVLYSLLNNNRHPFLDPNKPTLTYNERKQATDRRLSGEPLPPPCNASPQLANIVLCACSFDPQKRFKTPTAFKNALLSVSNQARSVPIKSTPKTVTSNTLPPVKTEHQLDKTVAVSNLPPKAPVTAEKHKENRKKKKNPLPVILIILVLLIGGAVASFMLIPELRELVGVEEVSEEKDSAEEKDDSPKEEKEEDTDKTVADTTAPTKQTEPAETSVPDEAETEETEDITEPEKSDEPEVIPEDSALKSLLTNANVGDIITLGSYEQDNSAENGAEALTWKVIDKTKDKILVVSVNSIDCIPYNENDSSVTWETSTLRTFLNADFYINNFSDEERAFITNSTVPNTKNPEFDTSAGNYTSDRIFLLSYDEVKKHIGFGENAKTYPTWYTRKQGSLSEDLTVMAAWWLRTPGIKSRKAAMVDENGNADLSGAYVDSTNVALRPAMYLSIK